MSDNEHLYLAEYNKLIILISVDALAGVAPDAAGSVV
jgi:hypothetical protein